MPTGFLSHLTAALLAMHTVLGCCTHHEHACGHECDSAASVESPDDAHTGHGDDACDTADSESHENHGPHDCQGSTCVFVRPAEDGAFSAAFQFDLPSFACVAYESSSAHAPAGSWPHFTADALLPPLRLHLAHQVLLL